MGQITGKDNNRVPTVEECNDAFGGDYVTQDDLSGFLTTSDISESHGISQCWYSKLRTYIFATRWLHY